MNELWTIILQNLTYTGIGMALFICAYVSNMAFSIWYNTQNCNEEFDWKRFFKSLLKIVYFGIGTILLCIGVTTVPIFCDYIGLTLPEEYIDVFEKLAIVAVFVYASCKYLTEAFTKFKAILLGDE